MRAIITQLGGKTEGGEREEEERTEESDRQRRTEARLKRQRDNWGGGG